MDAGIDEEAGDLWELGTDDYTFTERVIIT